MVAAGLVGGSSASVNDFGEIELKCNVGTSGVGVVDVDRVVHVLIKRKEVRILARRQRGLHGHDERDLGRIVVTHECIKGRNALGP